MFEELQQLLNERHEWRLRRRRRNQKVSERCAIGWRNLTAELHREIVIQNSVARRPKLGIRLSAKRLDVHRIGHLAPLISFVLDDDNVQIVSCAPIYSGSVLLSDRGKILAAFLGSVLILDPDGRMLRFGYEEAAEELRHKFKLRQKAKQPSLTGRLLFHAKLISGDGGRTGGMEGVQCCRLVGPDVEDDVETGDVEEVVNALVNAG